MSGQARRVLSELLESLATWAGSRGYRVYEHTARAFWLANAVNSPHVVDWYAYPVVELVAAFLSGRAEVLEYEEKDGDIYAVVRERTGLGEMLAAVAVARRRLLGGAVPELVVAYYTVSR